MDSETTKPRRGRKPTGVLAVPTKNPIDLRRVEEAGNAAQELGNGICLALKYEDVFRKLGQIEALEFTRRVGDVAIAKIFESVRKSKSYLGLPYKTEDGEYSTIGSFSEFCEVKLGKSYNRCFELSQNLRTLGEELYEQSEKLGFRNVDYRAINALPSNELDVVSQAIRSNDLDAVKQVLQEFAANKQLDDEAHKRELEKASERISVKDQEIVQTRERIAELVADKNRSEGLTEAEKLAELENKLFKSTISAIAAVLVMRNQIHTIRTLDKPPQGLYVACTGAIQRVTSDLMSIATDYGFELALASDPELGDDDPRKVGADWLADRLQTPAVTV